MGNGKRDPSPQRGNCFSFYGLLLLMAASLLPLACAQPPTAAPTAGSTTTAPVPAPTPMVTIAPTTSVSPTSSPTASPRPPVSPTDSQQQPTWSPTILPPNTPRPTGQPSISPNTDYPSAQPSSSPTAAEPIYFQKGEFNQRFQIGNEREFNETEQVWFCETMEGYTDDFGGRDDELVNTTCEIILQRLQIIGGSRKLREGFNNNDNNDRRVQGLIFNQVEYSMTYRSNSENGTTYLSLFEIYINGDLDRLTADLQNAGLAVTGSFSAFKNIATEAPTTIPITGPTMTPSTSAPSLAFTQDPATPIETAAGDNGGRKTSTVVTVSVIAALSVILVALVVFYRQHKCTNKGTFQEQAAAAGASTTDATGYVSRSEMHVDTGQPYNDTTKNGKTGRPSMNSPADSLASKGLISSAATSPLSEGSERQDDEAHALADEFDQYKDQNLEKMRTGVEDNISGFDGMMSQALTKALMGDDDTGANGMNELRWGGSGDCIEIEATALYEVTDWLKRKQGAAVEERGAFMQEMLDRMVASVRYGVMDPECGSRAIHECAALLGLQLASTIPGNTMIVSGMPKWVQTTDLLSAFSEFGEIQDAAVASNRRGFGLVRFKSRNAANAALSKFRTGEIVVQDVAVMIKVLKSDDDSERREWAKA